MQRSITIKSNLLVGSHTLTCFLSFYLFAYGTIKYEPVTTCNGLLKRKTVSDSLSYWRVMS